MAGIFFPKTSKQAQAGKRSVKRLNMVQPALIPCDLLSRQGRSGGCVVTVKEHLNYCVVIIVRVTLAGWFLRDFAGFFYPYGRATTAQILVEYIYIYKE